MKRVLRTVCLSLLSLFLAQLACGQDQVPLLISGKKQGSVSALTKNGTTYVDLQKTARKLGASVELFARSKQVKITARGFYAILTASLPEIILNAQTVRMPGAVFSESSTMYVPVEFFLLPQFGKAVGKEISFVNGALEVERPFDFARIDTLIGSKQDQLVFAFGDYTNLFHISIPRSLLLPRSRQQLRDSKGGQFRFVRGGGT